MTPTTRKPGVSIRSVAVPAEHGGWGFLVEPMLLGLIVAPSLPGAAICIAAAAAFLLHQPLKIAVKDRAKGRVFERTRLAQRFVLLYGMAAAAAFAAATLTGDIRFWVPLLIALPPAAVQLYAEYRSEGRSLISESAGALALAATAPAIILAAQGDAQSATATAALAWLLLALRGVPSILYVRLRLRQIRGKSEETRPTDTRLAVGAHIVGVGLTFALWAGAMISPLATAATGILLARAVRGLTSAVAVPARVVGVQEVIIGLVYALLCALAL